MRQYLVLADFLVRNTLEVLTCAGPAPRRGAAQADARAVARAGLASHQGRIVFVGFERCSSARSSSRPTPS